jgi:hypothetical protein
MPPVDVTLRRFETPDEVREFEKGRFEHVGLVVSGAATAAFDDGRVFELRAGELFYIPPIPHDSWVIGDHPYVSPHVMGADDYAASK